MENLTTGKITVEDFDRLVPGGDLGKASIVWGMDDPLWEPAQEQIERRIRAREVEGSREQLEALRSGFRTEFRERPPAEDDSDIWGEE